MLQEVQTATTNRTESTLETIEAVGTSSRKIIEWRQTIGWHSISKCVASGNVGWQYKWDWNRNSDYLESSNLAVSSSTWPIEFTTKSHAIRLPVQWSYECEMTWWISSSQRTGTIYVKVWSETVYTNTINSVTTKTAKFKFNAGKFANLTLWAEFYWSGNTTSVAWLEFNPAPSLKIELL